MYFVYITKAEYLHSASDKIKPTLCLVLTYNMNFQTLCAERLQVIKLCKHTNLTPPPYLTLIQIVYTVSLSVLKCRCV